MRYTGCTIRLYRSADVDYIVSYDNQWPLKSTMKMYNSMQPQIHYLLRHRIIVTYQKNKSKQKKTIQKSFYTTTNTNEKPMVLSKHTS